MEVVHEVRSNNGVVYRCAYHVVWCSKYRRSVLDEEVAARLSAIAHEVCSERGALISELGVQPDHVHALLSVDPQYGIHRLVKLIKGRSSRLLRREFARLRSRLPTLWTNSYFVATVGGATLEAVKRYIDNQRNA